MKKSAQEMVTELERALKDKTLTKAEYVRVQAVLMRKLKQKRSLIAQVSGKSLSVVEDWIIAYNKYGISGLRTKKRETQPRAMLSNKKRKHITELLQRTPSELGLSEEDYWNMALVAKLVKKETKVVYKSTNSYRKLLQEAGLSYQKVEFEDKRKNQTNHDEFKKQFEAKIKGGRISMWW